MPLPQQSQAQSGIDREKLKWRLQMPKFKVERLDLSNVSFSLQEALGGLPKGLTVFYGPAGAGKSLMAKTISVLSGVKVLYVVCESYSDAPLSENVSVANYTAYLPKPSKAMDEVMVLAEMTEAKLIVIDSLTTFLSATNKAVSEADIRDPSFEIAKRAEEKGLFVIGISQVRGSGVYEHPAGGEGVKHAAHLLLYFRKVLIDSSWLSKRYGKPEGSFVFTLWVEKDKHGKAKQNTEFVVEYKELRPVLKKVGV